MIDITAFTDELCAFGFFTDLHHSDKAANENRYHRDAVKKLTDAVTTWNALDLDFVICNGDLIDHLGQGSTKALSDLAIIEAVYAGVNTDRFYTLGNHDMDALSKAQFIANTGADRTYYSFDRGGVHFIVLDAEYTADSDSAHYNSGNYMWDRSYIPSSQRSWLANDLASTSAPCVVFCHQRLDGSTVFDVTNASAVRAILQASGKVIAVFSGHHHTNDYDVVNGIPYINMMAMTEDAYPKNAYAVVRVKKDKSMSINGYGQQLSRD